ncbi:uncharacterized protein LOC143239611 [Tachypleus tridentatus]|uniref:uncharacterized protein LOC143239611 n=1 Tax=Tachypleus tridentatus TaxID=6853 RepID=UPI003FD3B2BA
MFDKRFEGTADFVGKVCVEGTLSELTLQRCLKTLPLFSNERLGRSYCENTWNVQANEQVLTASCNKLNSRETHRVDIGNILFCYLSKECLRTIVWVVKGVSDHDPKEAWVWRCATEEDALQLYRMYYDVAEKSRALKEANDDNVKIINGKNGRRLNNELSTVIAEGVNARKFEEPKTIRPTGSPHITITLISQEEENTSDISIKQRNNIQSTEDVRTEEKPKVPPRARKKTPPPRPPRKPIKQTTLTTSQETGKSKTLNSPLKTIQLDPDKTKEIKSSSGVSDELEATKRNPNREVLVAATRSGRDCNKSVSTRQREPAKLLPSRFNQNFQASKISRGMSPHRPSSGVSLGTLVKNLLGGENVSKDLRTEEIRPIENHLNRQKSRSSLEISSTYTGHEDEFYPLTNDKFPREPLRYDNDNYDEAESLAVTYTKWIASAGSGDPQIHSGLLRKIFGKKPINGISGSRTPESSGISCSSSRPELLDNSHILLKPLKSNKSKNLGLKFQPLHVTRSGSLTSEESDSGPETKPKSALKKPKTTSFDCPHESKKNVTFNTMTTVQVMEE